MKAQDLKNSILQLAIQGKLVPQDANDEPAEVLYAKIQAEKQKLIKEGKIKKDKPLPPITDDEIPFAIPSTWKWVRLGDIFAHNTGKALNSSKQEGKLKKYITTSNVYWNYFQLNEVREMRFNDDEIQKCTVTKGDLLVCEGGDIGRTAIWNYDYDICIQNHIHRLRAYSEVCTMFFYYIFFLYKMAGYIGGKGIGIQGLSSGALHNIWVPFPPLAEQKRIVAKIEELDPLVKQYDKAETELSTLNDSFPEQLKKSILQYAIQGKLVPQDVNDEPAEVLYAKIQTEKQKLIKEGKIKKDKPLPPITDDEIPFSIPPSWKWVRLKDLGIINPRNNLSDSIEVTFLPMNCIYSDFYKDIDTSNKKKWGEVKSGYTHIAENDVIMAKITPCFENGKSAIAKNLLNGYGAATTEIHVFRRVIELNLNYILVYLKSPFFMDYATKHMTGTAGQKRVPQNIFAEYFFPLPPLAEQHRIVAKVNELLQYCEKLKI